LGRDARARGPNVGRLEPLRAGPAEISRSVALEFHRQQQSPLPRRGPSPIDQDCLTSWSLTPLRFSAAGVLLRRRDRANVHYPGPDSRQEPRGHSPRAYRRLAHKATSPLASLSEMYVVDGFQKTPEGSNGGGDPWHTDG